ncbi:FKBP-type peptidyl-prolyl cis-trans isomerase [Pedobacter sp. PLR]|uniref:FKBP-type peptidyl-prolyl cis-trans isomerase n=1 Tax=Pedobacter sp. PLR TaxID=2994465 RepID=UPI0022479126|nr:FKBP-type peptidyl-prolyl cis-trans isomerase [Pedobacter sp. PLR]MCX2451440.1 FKBP-type peptidyl-prolyl cis-trans isomerase [Pedobacter sp. PLR]
MKTIKHLFLLVCTAVCFAGCAKEFDQEKQFSKDKELIRKFIADQKIPEKDVVEDPSGLFYQIIKRGDVAVVYTPNTVITAAYEGRLLNGSVFDNGGGKAISFPLGGVITGWQIGIPKINVGGEIRLLIPSQLAYKNEATGGIPENSVLDFTVKLIDAK